MQHFVQTFKLLNPRRMRHMCEESKSTGMATMSALQNQGESIERWEDVVDGINEVNYHKIFCYDFLWLSNSVI